MEGNSSEGSSESADASVKNDFLEITSNWQIDNNTRFHDAITTVALLDAPERTSLGDIVSLDTCISLQRRSCEPCMLDIKITNNRKIARIAVVSDAYVLEFFKQFGEYATTVFAEFIDEFEGHSIHFAEAIINPAATEASIKFTKVKSTERLWIYGIKLILTEPSKRNDDMFNPDIIQNLLINSNIDPLNKKFNMAKELLNTFSKYDTDGEMFHMNYTPCTSNPVDDIQCTDKRTVDNKEKEIMTRRWEEKNDRNDEQMSSIKEYIDNKFRDMEIRLMQRIDEMECGIYQKLDTILKRVG